MMSELPDTATETFTWFIKGEPVAWTAPSLGKRGAYQGNQSLTDWEETVNLESQSKYLAQPFAGPVRLELTFHRTPPKSWPKWKKRFAAGRIIQEKPDCDNLSKAVTDALEDVIFLDDGRVADLHVTKLWRPKDQPPGVLISVSGWPRYPKTREELQSFIEKGYFDYEL